MEIYSDKSCICGFARRRLTQKSIKVRQRFQLWFSDLAPVASANLEFIGLPEASFNKKYGHQATLKRLWHFSYAMTFPLIQTPIDYPFGTSTSHL